MSLALALVVASIDERHRSFHNLHDGHVTGRADLKTAELGCAVDHGGRFDGRHGDHLLEREAEPHELAHDPGQIRHARRVAGEDVNVGGDGVRQAALLNGGFRYRVVEAAATVADVEYHAALLGGERPRQQPTFLHDIGKVAGEIGESRI